MRCPSPPLLSLSINLVVVVVASSSLTELALSPSPAWLLLPLIPIPTMAQQPHDASSSADMGDQDMDAAYKLRDNRLVGATVGIAQKVAGRNEAGAPGTPAEASAGMEDITRTEKGVGDGPSGIVNADGIIEVMCGPLLNYKRMSQTTSGGPIWHGTVLIVTKPLGHVSPSLQLRYAGRVHQNASSTVDGEVENRASLGQSVTIPGLKLYEDPDKAFWRFPLELPLQDHESVWEYTIPDVRFSSGKSARINSTKAFVVPAGTESMRIMFHSCNGFSVGTDEDAWSGPALWRDVLRVHNEKPFHVMIGGGDQIYNDGVRVGGPLKPWTKVSNPSKRRDYPFSEELRVQCDQYYFDNYVRWFSTESFASANGIIPQVNIWDDHGRTPFNRSHGHLLTGPCRHHRWIRQLYGPLHAMPCFSRHRQCVFEVLPPLPTSHSSSSLHLHDRRPTNNTYDRTQGQRGPGCRSSTA